jgi:hypothetical protein
MENVLKYSGTSFLGIPKYSGMTVQSNISI